MIFIIFPFLFFIIFFKKNLHNKNVDVKLISITCFHSIGDILKDKLSFVIPALLISISGQPPNSSKEIKSLLISQIEKKVRWLESIEYMINNGVKNFVEIGPGKVLSGLIKRINKNVIVNSINSEEDIKFLINDKFKK